MKARGSIVVDAGDCADVVLKTAISEPPFSIRQSGSRILVAASAAAPVGGDDLSLNITVLAGASADVGTVASTIVLPGPTGAPSVMATNCTVGADAHLDWVGEPTVSVAGSDHTVTTTVDLDASATCRIVEEVSLGRTGEPSGRLRLVMCVDRGDAPLLRQDEVFGPDVLGAGSVVSTGAARHVWSEVRVGVVAGESRVSRAGECGAAWLPLADDAVLILAVGPDRPAVQAVVTAVCSRD